MKLPQFLRRPEPVFDMSTPEARAMTTELIRRRDAETAPPPRVVDFSRPPIPTGPPPRWFETPGLTAFQVVRRQPPPRPRIQDALPDIVD
ncbi:hypothetical protein [Streptomyces sp. IMTB 1903]|uniref:hypothetical protein n=1 Tax=Streptomyces sp. IMTB 1903 TaxID=1776680 RepID=UPI000757307A|nr:hypothetical protein [Streptomyces sp. IMTB 1903]